jgi:hypothetical protein
MCSGRSNATSTHLLLALSQHQQETVGSFRTAGDEVALWGFARISL